MKAVEYIKSPLNYTGGKFKQIEFLISHFPEDIDFFYDVFCGGGNVFINVSAKKYRVNEKFYPIANLYKYLIDCPLSQIIEDIETTIKRYELSKDNKEGFIKLRSDYNYGKFIGEGRPYQLLCLAFHSFNNQIRFNRHEEFNMTFGGRDFNENIRSNLEKFSNRLKNINPVVCANDFENFIEEVLYRRIEPVVGNGKRLFYFDPPYANTNAAYNKEWDDGELKRLLKVIDLVHKNNFLFALSETFIYKGERNEILYEWAEKNNHNVHHVNSNFNHCSYHCRNRDGKLKTDEVLITNY